MNWPCQETRNHDHAYPRRRRVHAVPVRKRHARANRLSQPSRARDRAVRGGRLVRHRRDKTPTFSPDDSRIYYASQGADPRTGEEPYQTYHGFEVLESETPGRLDAEFVREAALENEVTLDPFLQRGNGEL